MKLPNYDSVTISKETTTLVPEVRLGKHDVSVGEVGPKISDIVRLREDR